MFPNARGSEQLALLASIDPASQSAGTIQTDWISLAPFHQLLAIIQTGAMGTNGTLAAKLQQATDTSGTGAKDVPGKSITTLAQAEAGASRQVLIDVCADDLDVMTGYVFVRLSLTTAVAASLIAAHVVGLTPRFAPAVSANQASVVQVV